MPDRRILFLIPRSLLGGIVEAPVQLYGQDGIIDRVAKGEIHVRVVVQDKSTHGGVLIQICLIGYQVCQGELHPAVHLRMSADICIDMPVDGFLKNVV